MNRACPPTREVHRNGDGRFVTGLLAFLEGEFEVAEDFVGELADFLGGGHVGPGSIFVVSDGLGGTQRSGGHRGIGGGCRWGRGGTPLGELQWRFHMSALWPRRFLGTICASSLNHWDPVRGRYCI